MKMLIFLILLPALSLAIGDEAVLYLSYLDFQIVEQVGQQVRQMSADSDFETGAEIELAYDDWRDERLRSMRRRIENRFGEQSRARFERFFAAIQTAESERDSGLLTRISGELELNGGIENYTALKQTALAEHCRDEIDTASKFLGEIQTWIGLKDSGRDVPPLAHWLARAQPVERAAPPTTAARAANPLRAAEGQSSGDWLPEDGELVNPMDSFADRRKAERDRALADAQEGMRQIAQERAAYEQEAAAKELARAQADAEAMRDQAQRLAATEKEALAQRENSWGNRLKRIVGGTISAATGAFTGGIGSEAGRRAADAVFN
jgi:pyruvate/2-oxoglutarate dehydrogenase complex dihydrolipoamide acyltransferase (E2) component